MENITTLERIEFIKGFRRGYRRSFREAQERLINNIYQKIQDAEEIARLTGLSSARVNKILANASPGE